MAANKTHTIMTLLAVFLITAVRCTHQDGSVWESSAMETRNREPVSEHSPSSNNHSQCPTWMTKHNASDDTCYCGHAVNAAVKCDARTAQAYILDCYCMTYTEEEGAVVGKCFYRCAASNDKQDPIYHPLPQDLTQLNEEQCGGLNRGGRLCGSCKAGYSPLVYSYDLHCKNCTDNHYRNTARFVAAAFIPLTLFYLFVVVFQFNANSPRLYGFFIVVQAVSAPENLRIMLTYAVSKDHPGMGAATKFLMMLYGISNLDFFRTFYTDICLEINPLQTLALDYAVAFYPLVLILISYALITVYSNDYRAVVWLGRPLVQCLTSIRKRLQTNTSMIEVIATFLLLSYTKILGVTVDLLLYTRVYDVNGRAVGTFLYYDASVEYFGREHLPYAITAIFVLATCVLLPVLLLFLYPLKCFQKFLNCTKLRSRVLDTFIDSFQGCYKDGTEAGTRDCRWFSAMTFLIRILYIVIYAITLNSTFYAASMIVLLGYTVLFITFQPYKAKFHVYNAVEASMLLCLVTLQASVLCINMSLLKSRKLTTLALWTAFIIACIPLLYITAITLRWVLEHTQCGQRCSSRFKRSRLHQPVDEESDSRDCEELPHRMDHPGEYQALLPPGEGGTGKEQYDSCHDTQQATY